MIGDIQKWWKSSPASLVVTGNALEKFVRNYLRQLPQDSSVLDVGGGDGRLIRQYLKYLPKGRHHVLEPIPDLYLKLRSLLGSHVNLTLHNRAATDQEEHTSYVHFLRGFSEDPEPVRLLNGKAELLNVLVPCMPIDLLVPEEDFQLVIFRQGGRLGKAIAGGKALIERNHPTLIFGSTGHRNYQVDQPEHLFETLEAFGYGMYLPESENMLTASEFINAWGSKKENIFLAKVS